MHLFYFDENKHSAQNPFFFIGGILIQDSKIALLENMLMQIQYAFFGTSILTKDTELHGVDIFHGKHACRAKKLNERIQLLEAIVELLVDASIPVRMVCIDVETYQAKNGYSQTEYNLGFMLILERFCDYLDRVDDIGLVFGDYEKDEIAKSILNFSEFKRVGKTPMGFGRPLNRLKDTVYFTHSHHSRFLQIADIVVYLANRYEHNNVVLPKWHEQKAKEIWERVKLNTDFNIQRWPG